MERSLVIIPTFNERPNIERLIGRLMNVSDQLDILIIDDNSPDDTGKIIDQISRENQRVCVIHRPRKLGLGSAYVQGFKFALDHGYAFVITMDADLSHRPRYIPTFLDRIKDCDMLIGSRWIPGGRIVNWSLMRLFLSRLANIYTQWVLGRKVKDWTGGFNTYRCEFLRKINPEKVHSDGYSFQIEMKHRVLENHGRIIEIPITFPDRKAGKSKISKRIVLEALFIVWWFRLGLHANHKA